MKIIFPLLFILILSATVSAQTTKSKTGTPDLSKKIDTLQATCGMCQFDLKGDDCALAVRINGKPYYVEGTQIDDHGDAHATDGFCNMVRTAAVQGSLVGDKYKVTYFKLLPASAPPAKQK